MSNIIFYFPDLAMIVNCILIKCIFREKEGCGTTNNFPSNIFSKSPKPTSVAFSFSTFSFFLYPRGQKLPV